MGRLSDRYGRVPLITAGLVLGGIATATLILSSNYFVIAALIAVFGLGLATVTASTSCLVADLSRSQGRGGALGILSSIMDIGQSTGPMVAGALITAYSYRFTFGVVGAGLVVISLVYWLGMRRIATCPPTS
jgi:MFS family permease